MLNDLRMFVMSLDNTQDYSVYLPEFQFNHWSHEGGLLPRTKFVAEYGTNVFQRSVSKGSWVKDKMKELKVHGYDFEHWLKESKLPNVAALYNPTPNGDEEKPDDVKIPTKEELSSSVTLEVHENGGHLGFISGSIFKPKYWLDKRILSYLFGKTV